MSPAEHSRSGRRRRRRSADSAGGKRDSGQVPEAPRMRTVRETSAGGLVINGLDDETSQLRAALIGRIDRRGRLLWSMPKGHVEHGETVEETAMREVAEETGIRGQILASLGSIDYWFVSEGRRIHKTVHHYLLRYQGGELSDEDYEVSEVAWVPLSELDHRLAYADERKLARLASKMLTEMMSGPQAGPHARTQASAKPGPAPGPTPGDATAPTPVTAAPGPNLSADSRPRPSRLLSPLSMLPKSRGKTGHK
nr:NUDIX hydrolase [Tomitella biformata]